MEAADRNHVDVVRVFFDQYSTEVDSTEIPTLVSSIVQIQVGLINGYISQLIRMKHSSLLWRKDTQRLLNSFTDVELTLPQSQRLAP